MSLAEKPAAPPGDTVDLGELGTSLGFLLRLAQLQAFERFYDRLGRHDLRPGEYSALWVIRRNPGIRQGLLARTLRIKPAHMTKMVRRLEEQGRIRREIPDDDRRSVLLSLTREGAEFVDRHRAEFLDQETVHPALSAAEARQLATLLRRMTGFDHAGPSKGETPR